jgi:hypothetical protein
MQAEYTPASRSSVSGATQPPIQRQSSERLRYGKKNENRELIPHPLERLVSPQEGAVE